MIQTELHRHLDVSLRPETLLELLKERGLEAQSTSPEAFRDKLILKAPMSDLGAVLRSFGLFQQVFDRPDVMERVAFEVVEDCWREGTRQVELRFSPGFACELSKLPWRDALDGFETGMNRAISKYPQMKAGLICISSREYGTEGAWETVEFFLANRERFLGLDLAGDEARYPARAFSDPFKKAKKEGARITVHAGEASGAETVWEAIEDLGAERIGHGVASINDAKLMEYLKKNDICLEICPTSNWLTQAVPSFEAHPLPLLLRAGVPVSINTDDPGMFGATLQDEIRICRERLGMSQAEINRCFEHAQRCSFFEKKG